MPVGTGAGQPWWLHVLIVLALGTFCLGWFWPWVVASPMGLADSSAYFGGFRAVGEGQSPYVHSRFLYPPLFAHVGAWFTQQCQLATVAVFLQLVDLLAASALVWMSLAVVVPTLPVRLLAAPVLLALLPPVRDSISTGNIAVAMTALGFGCALFWPRRPMVAGVLFGLTLALKPMALGLLPVLVAQRSTSRRRAWLTMGSAIAIAVASLALYPDEASQMLGHATRATAGRTVSLHAALRELGLRIPALAITAAIGLAGAVFVHRRAGDLGPTRLAYLACSLSLGMLPVISNGSLALGIPVIVGALVIALRRLRASWSLGPMPKRRSILELMLVIGGTIVFCGGDAWGLWPEAPPALRGLTMTAPLLALVGLTRVCLKG